MTLGTDHPGPRPRFSLVTVVGDADDGVEDFIASVEEQEHPLEHVEVLVVDATTTGGDARGSRTLDEWRTRRPELVTVVRWVAEDGGSPRNAGLEHARGEWITFPDPGDRLTPAYLARIDAFLSAHPEAALVTGNPVHRDREGHEVPHPLRRRFQGPDRVRDLGHYPGYFCTSAETSFVRRDLVEREGLRFDARAEPGFSGGHLCARYLLAAPRPVVGFVGSAEYLTRLPGEQSAATDPRLRDTRRYTDVLEHGYLDLFRAARSRADSVPEWLQSLVLYELSWHFEDEEATPPASAVLSADAARRCERLLVAIARALDPTSVAGFWLRRFEQTWRDVLLSLRHGDDDASWHAPYVLVDRLDSQQRLVRQRYRYHDDPPVERFRSDGQEVLPAFAKSRALRFFGRTLLQERIAWVPDGDLGVRLDDVDVPVRLDEPARLVQSLPLRDIRERHVPTAADRRLARDRPAGGDLGLTWRERLLARVARTAPLRRAFADAWVLVDSVAAEAGREPDEARLLFEHLRHAHRGVNAWLVVPEHARGPRSRARRHAVTVGSLRWKLLMLNAQHLVTTRDDPEVTRPETLGRFGPPRWRVALLAPDLGAAALATPDGETHLDLIATGDRAGHDDMVADGSPSPYGPRELRLTGSPSEGEAACERVVEAIAASTRPVPPVLVSPEDDGEPPADLVAPSDGRPAAPRFSLVVAVYDVADYLDGFIESVEAQDFPLDRVEVVMVDDGSTDTSAERLEAWQRRRPGLVRVLTKPNGGQGSARNAGLGLARGDWVTFPDPDDLIAPDYLSEVDAFLRAHPATVMAGAQYNILDEATGDLVGHPLRHRFEGPNRLRDLDHSPDYFHASANAAFFRREVLERERLRFDELIRPNFEDGHFCVSYLLAAERPLVGFVGTAVYYYRKRRSRTSTLDTSVSHPGRYTVVCERGYLDCLRRAHRRRGSVPGWLQSLILYELSYYFQVDEAAGEMSTAAYGEVAEEFHRHLSSIVGLLEASAIRSFALRRFEATWREALLHAVPGATWHSEQVVVDGFDPAQRLVRARYRYTDTPPSEEFSSKGVPVEPVFAKTRVIRYFDRDLLHERIVWLPAGAIRAALDGTTVDVRLQEPDLPTYTLPRSAIERRLAPPPVDRSPRRTPAGPRRADEWLVLRLSRTRLAARLFGRAWVLLDRVDNADDSAEVLFRYLREERRGVNAWFVIRGGTPDHRRLRAAGYKRVVPYGSLRWKVLMLNARHVISSHADAPVHSPEQITRLATPTWRFTFLQHGVIKDDLSRWLNPKQFDLFVTSTPAEHRSVAGDGSPYVYGERETRMTGLPRFDPLREAGLRFGPGERDLVLLAPTWRQWLTTRTEGRRHTIPAEEFVETDFARHWLGLLASPRVADAAEREGLRVALLLHPDLQPLATHLDLPDHVDVLHFEGRDVRETFARARVLVTDYSSMAFNAAYIDRPVVYFQFDRDRVFTGGHLGRPGYFDYGRDGFGPVAETLDAAVDVVCETVAGGPDPSPTYAARIAATFPVRDGRCTERVFEAIKQSERPRRGHTVERSRPSQ